MSKQNKDHYKRQGLTKQETETYLICKGQCTICLLNGACVLQTKIKGQNDGCKDKQEQKQI